jgi:membrane protease YdiL (CAAX protease family)
MRKAPWTFFALTLAFAAPFWLLGAVTGFVLMPGVPIAAYMFVCPAVAAACLTFQDGGRPAASAFFARALGARCLPSGVWLLPALALIPALSAACFALLRLSGTAIPAPQTSLAEVLALSVPFMVAAMAEELGWSGYATEPLAERYGALGAAVIIGGVWSAFHLIALIEVGRSAAWIVWWTLGTFALRVLIVWIFVNTGRSVFAASLMHASSNLAWQLFPIHGSFFDPQANAVVVSAAALGVVAIWGPQTLAGRGRTMIVRLRINEAHVDDHWRT